MTVLLAPMLLPAATFPPRADLHATYTSHAAGGLTPIAVSDQGSLTVHCPYPSCGEVLIRGVNADALAQGYFQCATCHRKSLGLAAVASMRRREAGTLWATQRGARPKPSTRH